MARALLPALLLPLLLPAAFPQEAAGPAGKLRRQAFRRLEAVVAEAIAAGRCPGALVLAGRGDDLLYRRAFGLRAVVPRREPMTAGTIFDLASLTKPVATALSAMLLAERGQLDLDAPVRRWLPGFTGEGKERITPRHLLLHRGGLTADNPLADYREGPAKAWARICALPLLSPPGARFRYTDVGFIVLGRLVERISGKRLDTFARENLFAPLGMETTCFNPPPALRERIAPTQRAGGRILRGTVHDPRARLLGGVAGHAGLFSTGDDLARLCRMLLREGELDGVRILRVDTVREMTALRPGCGGRALGWDLTSGYASPRGHWLTRGVSFGHSGFTGTSLWIDPATKAWVVFLSSRCHPDGKGNVVSLRRKVATCAGRALGLHLEGTLPGIEVLDREGFRPLRGARVGLITNHTGRTRDGFTTIELLRRAPGVELKALFSPEHGLEGELERRVDHGRHTGTRLRVWSLYGKTRRPTAEMLAGLDTLVFDIQDIGARFYTYISTMLHCLEAAAAGGLRFVVLDRPNPIGGHRVFGPLPDRDMLGFTACAPIPLVHGMTVGELARLFRRMKGLECRLQVVPVAGWRRSQWLDETDIPWVDTSPNMRSLRAATLYPAVCLLEACNLSVGRGTERPFELFGAPWIEAERLAAALNGAKPGGVVFRPLEFTPRASRCRGEKCGGVEIAIRDRERIDPLRLGITLVQTLHRLHGKEFAVDRVNHLLRNRKIHRRIVAGDPPERIEALWQEDLAAFRKLREAVLLYE